MYIKCFSIPIITGRSLALDCQDELASFLDYLDRNNLRITTMTTVLIDDDKLFYSFIFE